MLKPIIFDMDGVLFDTEKLGLLCWDEAGKKYGVEGVAEIAMHCIGTTAVRTKEIITEHYGDQMPYDEIRSEKSRLMHTHFIEEGMPMKPYVFELMNALKADGYMIGLATSTRRDAVEEELALCGLDVYFDTVVCGDELKRSKPAPDIFLKCAENLQAEPCKTFVIEDSYNGIRAAHRASMRPIMVPDLVPADEEMEELAEAIVQNLDEVRKYLGLPS